jgi:hypothetical protein
MAGATHKTTVGDGTNATSYATASFSSTNGDWLLAFVSFAPVTGPGVLPTLSSTHGTWELVGWITTSVPTSSLRLCLFICQANGNTGTATIDFSGNTQIRCLWSITEFSGLASTYPVVQVAHTTVTSQTPSLAFPAAAENAANIIVGGINAGNVTIGEGSGLTELGETGIIESGSNLQSEWKNGTASSMDWSNSASSACLLYIVELRTAAPSLLALRSKTTSGSGTNATSYATASITSTSGKHLIAMVGNIPTSGTAAQPTLSSAHGTWINRGTYLYSTTDRHTLFTCLANGSSGAVTIDFGAQTQNRCLWSILETDRLAPDGPVVQLVGNTQLFTAAPSVALSAFENAKNGVLATSWSNADNLCMSESGFALGGDSAFVEAATLRSFWKHHNDTTASFTLSASTGCHTIGVELRHVDLNPGAGLLIVSD